MVNRKKKTVILANVEYLGHVVIRKRGGSRPKKIEAMVQWPCPKDVKGLRGFLGLANGSYYRRFVRQYRVIAKPLTDLLKKDSFRWSQVAQQTFERLKTAMTSPPILAVHDFSKPFILGTNTSNKGFWGCIISRRQTYSKFKSGLL